MIEKDLGFVLKRYNFRETSLITTLYTQNFGKIRGIFKGFYTQKREFSSPLDIFSLNEFIFYPKKSEIWLISHADLISEYSFLRTDVDKARVAGVMLSLIDKTMQLWDKSHYIFNLVNNCLNLLAKDKEAKILYIFLIKFLTSTGFKPEFNHCITCRKLLPKEVLFSASKGGFICRSCYPKAKDARKISNQTSQSLLYIQKNDFPLVCRINPTQNCEQEIFYVLHEFLSFHFEFNGLAKYKIINSDLLAV